MSAPALFEIDNLHASATSADQRTPILQGINLTVDHGEVHVVLGPAGSDKSALAATLLGSPAFEVTGGAIRLHGDDITRWGADVRSKAGIFLSFPDRADVPGVSILTFMRQALSARKGIDLSILELRLTIMEWMERLDIDPAVADHFLHEQRSASDRKRHEMLQMALLEPDVVVLDETGDGHHEDPADDAGKVVAGGLREVRKDLPGLGVIVVTHRQRLIADLEADHVHVLLNGKITASTSFADHESNGMDQRVSGRADLVDRLEREGYESWQ